MSVAAPHGADTSVACVVVVAGEASGDHLAAAALSHLAVPSFGIGGDALVATGTVVGTHLRDLTAMGFSGVIARGSTIVRAAARLRHDVLARRPRAALLVDFTELNARIGVWLRARGVPVLWLVAPQVWAWRPGRLHSLGRSMDRLAVLLDFEQRLWRSAGVDAHWVGHPVAAPRDSSFVSSASSRLASLPPARWLPLLPGSRSAEARALLEPMLDAARTLRERRSFRPVVLVASSLAPHHAIWVRERCRAANVETVEVDAREGVSPLLSALHTRGAQAAIAASGTATLECALAAIPPVILYRTDPVSAALARRLLCVDEIGLPNIVLGRRLFPELLQDAVTPREIVAHVLALTDSSMRWSDVANDLRERLVPPGRDVSFGERVASLVRAWL